MLVGSVLFGADELVASFVAQRIAHVRETGFGRRDPMTGQLPYSALGVVRRDVLLGGVVFHNFRGHDIEMSAAFDRPDWCYPQTLRMLFAYPFGQLPCVRMTTITGRKNKAARRIDEGLGFKLEGVVRRGLDGKEDAMIYGLLREECRWLKGKESGQQISSSASAAA